MVVEIEGLLDKQKEVINNILATKAKYISINASRQSGKSFTISKLAIILALKSSKKKILCVSPSYEQAKLLFDNIVGTENIERVITEKKLSKPFNLTFVSGTTISFKSADRPDLIRGGSYDYVICDEFSFFKEGVFNTIIRPTTAAKKESKIIVASTPKGKYNDFYTLSELGMSNNPNYLYLSMHYSDNIYYDIKEVEDARLRLPKNVFDQEYEALFIDNGGDVFEGLDLVLTLDEYPTFIENANYYGGIDWGRADDKTVLHILNQNKECVYLNEFGGDWNKQINDIGLILNQYKPIVYAESNGLGDPLISQLNQLYSNVVPFFTSNSSKKEIIEKLKMDILLKNIKLMSSKVSRELTKEMSNFTFSITKTGLITYHHRDGEHDDYVDSVALSNYAYNQHNVGFQVNFSRGNDFYDE